MNTLRDLLEELTDLVHREPHRADLKVKVSYGVPDEDGDVWETYSPLARIVVHGTSVVFEAEEP